MKNETQIIEMDINKLINATWNYKKDGTDEQYETLIKSIQKDKSVGVLAVREIEKDGKEFFEVMDGNHRLEAARRMNWDKVPIENFGPISLANAVVIARRRNHNWFEDDKLKLAHLFNDVVFKELDFEELKGFMPESEDELLAYKNIGDFDWTPPDEKPFDGESGAMQLKKIMIDVPEETYNVWLKIKERMKDNLAIENEAKIFELILFEASKSEDF